MNLFCINFSFLLISIFKGKFYIYLPSKSKSGTVVGAIFGVIIGLVIVIMITLFILKRNGKITSYLPTFLMKKVNNNVFKYSEQKDSELTTIVNKNFSPEL